MTTKFKINGPSKKPVGSWTYQDECVFALEPSVTSLIEMAIEAGWDRNQVGCALMCLAALAVDDGGLAALDSIQDQNASDGKHYTN